jgi:hypothetical protein
MIFRVERVFGLIMTRFIPVGFPFFWFAFANVAAASLFHSLPPPCPIAFTSVRSATSGPGGLGSRHFRRHSKGTSSRKTVALATRARDDGAGTISGHPEKAKNRGSGKNPGGPVTLSKRISKPLSVSESIKSPFWFSKIGPFPVERLLRYSWPLPAIGSTQSTNRWH